MYDLDENTLAAVARGDFLWGEPHLDDLDVEAGSMTLVIGAIASDGVVLAADDRETLGARPTLYVDGRQKLHRFGSAAACGFAGPATWAIPLLATHKAALPVSNTGEIARTVHGILARTPDFPTGVSWIFAGLDPAPGLVLLEHRGTAWATPVRPLEGFCVIGVGYLARWLMQTFYRPQLRLESVVALCHLALRGTASYVSSVGPCVNMAVMRTGGEWTDDDRARAERRADDFVRVLREELER